MRPGVTDQPRLGFPKNGAGPGFPFRVTHPGHAYLTPRWNHVKNDLTRVTVEPVGTSTKSRNRRMPFYK